MSKADQWQMVLSILKLSSFILAAINKCYQSTHYVVVVPEDKCHVFEIYAQHILLDYTKIYRGGYISVKWNLNTNYGWCLSHF